MICKRNEIMLLKVEKSLEEKENKKMGEFGYKKRFHPFFSIF